MRQGGCQCGALRYQVDGMLGKASICHCRMCQKAFGSWGATLINVPYHQFQWTKGVPSEFRSSMVVVRGFCSNCGTPMYMREDGDENIEMAIGTLDDPNDIPPLSHQSGIESRVHWFTTMAGLPEERTADYRTADDLVRLKSLQHPDKG
jgi:hypothetical protein